MNIFKFFAAIMILAFGIGNAYAQFFMSAPNPLSTTEFPFSYWIPAQISFSPVDGTGNLVWYGYASSADFVAGKAPIGSHAYSLNAATVTALLTALGLTMTTFEAPLYSYALSINDTPSGSLDDNGNMIMQSFFSGATNAR